MKRLLVVALALTLSATDVGADMSNDWYQAKHRGRAIAHSDMTPEINPSFQLPEMGRLRYEVKDEPGTKIRGSKEIGRGDNVTNSSIDLSKLEGHWIVERLASPGLDVALAVARSEKGNLLISVDTQYGFMFTTITVRPDGDVLKGTATLSEQEVDVEIRIKEGGTMMEGIPSGFRNLERWLFQRSAFHR